MLYAGTSMRRSLTIPKQCDASPTNSCTNCVRAHLGQRCRRCVRPQTERLEKKRKREGETEPEGGSIQSPRPIPTLDEAMLEQQQQPVHQSNKQRKRTQRQLNNVREREKVWQAAQSNMTPSSTLSIPRMPGYGPNAYEQPTFSQQPSMNAYATPFMPGLATTFTPGFAMDSSMSVISLLNWKHLSDEWQISRVMGTPSRAM